MNPVSLSKCQFHQLVKTTINSILGKVLKSFIALGIEYNGQSYCGWQKQSHSPSVQAPLEKALSNICAQEIKVFCAGRTDTGVHATNQVVHFEFEGTRPKTAWMRGVNNHLPNDISVVWSKEVDEGFHARFSATSRTYRYIIQNTQSPNATLDGLVTWHRNPLDVTLMNEGAQYLLGQHDFKSFQASGCQANTSIRTVESIKVIRCGHFITMQITANAFLLHMVRNVIGCLIQIGEGRQSPEFVKNLIALKDRTKAPDTAKPNGLYLIGVGYPDAFSLPKNEIFPLGWEK